MNTQWLPLDNWQKNWRLTSQPFIMPQNNLEWEERVGNECLKFWPRDQIEGCAALSDQPTDQPQNMCFLRTFCELWLKTDIAYYPAECISARVQRPASNRAKWGNHSKRVLQCCEWYIRGVIHIEILKPEETNTVVLICAVNTVVLCSEPGRVQE